MVSKLEFTTSNVSEAGVSFEGNLPFDPFSFVVSSPSIASNENGDWRNFLAGLTKLDRVPRVPRDPRVPRVPRAPSSLTSLSNLSFSP